MLGRVLVEAGSNLQHRVGRALVTDRIGSSTLEEDKNRGEQEQRWDQLQDRDWKRVNPGQAQRGAGRDKSDAGGIGCD